MPPYTLAIAGNPNAGKTSLFNAITGGSQKVGNYPGVTVEKKEGAARCGEASFSVIDLPGTYSLTAYSQEEVVARDFILDELPDVVIDVVDASNLERNLYLALQILEMGVPVVIALNMHDIARQRGIHIDYKRLGELIGAPIVATIAHRKEGIDELLRTAAAVAAAPRCAAPRRMDYGPILEERIKQLTALLGEDAGEKARQHPRWLAVKLLEQDPHTRERVDRESANATAILDLADKLGLAVEKEAGEDAATLIAEHRYGHSAGVVRECVRAEGDRQTVSDAIDLFACHRILGLLWVGIVIYLTFKLTFLLADGLAFVPWQGGWATPVGVMGWVFEEWLPSYTAPMAEGPLKSMLEEGVIAGLGGVMGFVPLIFFMFLFLGVIEDSGYIARIAFVLDRVLRAFGLQGKSILAMIISGGIAGGCAVPGVMATRTLREEKDRLTTMLVAPFMNCGAKMPVFAMLIAAFFSAYEGEMLVLLAVLSWTFALLAALVLRKTVIRGEQTPFVMELPPYHVPGIRAVIRSALQRSWMYMKKAGTIILAVNILLWAMMYFPQADRAAYDARIDTVAALEMDGAEREEAIALIEAEAKGHQLHQSIAGRLGRTLEPLSRLAGFDWRDNIALAGGFAAKEVIVSALSMAYSMGEAEGSESVAESATLPLVRAMKADPNWNRVRGFAMLLFVMLYAPCFVTVVAIMRESGSWKWALFSTAYSTALAFLVATAVYQVGLALGLAS